MKPPVKRVELAILLIVPVMAVLLSLETDIHEDWHDIIGDVDGRRTGSTLAGGFGLILAVLAISWLRWREASRQDEERRAIEEALRDSEARFRAIYANAGAGILLASPEGEILTANAAFQNIVGYDEEELRQIGWHDLIHPDDDPVTEAAANNSRGVERRFVHKNGDPIWLKLTTSYAFDPNDMPFLGIAVAEDVTARRRAEEALRDAHDDLERRVDQRTRELQEEIAERIKAEGALRESETKFRALIENALDFIMVLDKNGSISFQSPSIEESFGFRPAEMLGTSFFEYVHREDLIRVKDSFFRLMETAGMTASFQLRGRHADGSWRMMEVIAKNLIHDPVVGGIVINSRDVSERREAEDKAHLLQNELAHVARLSTMGEMAAGFAHELSQPLTAIHSYITGCLRRLRAGSENQDDIFEAMEQAAEQALRAGEIVSRIHWFIRRAEPELAPMVINDVIVEAVELMESEANHLGVSVQLDLTPDLPWAKGDTVQIQQTIINLARNGFEAMSNDRHGTRGLTIRTSLPKPDEIEIEVADTGPGIPSELRDHLFDPFVTTKSRGLGMGLATCRSIIDRHGGRISAIANGKRGTAVRFVLHVFDETETTKKNQPVIPADNPGEDESVSNETLT
ncbi:MAG: PAS domain S-box protein [Rhodospirillales bacterium]|nr:PAS domain S-box protein [Rhodospirillales bacterium]